MAAFGSFDSLNGFIVKGQAAAGISLIYDTLMTSSLDEPASEYGLVAESVRHPKDYSSVTYTLRPQAAGTTVRRSPPTMSSGRSKR